MNHNVLVCTDVVDDKSIRTLSKYSKVDKLADLTEDRLDEVLPSIDCLLVFSWPSQLTNERLQKMTSLRFIQSILAGVNHIPFASLNKSVIVSSNAGAYSDEVAEYALALLLSAAKRVVELHVSLRDQKWTLKRTLDEGSEITVLREEVLGILGFGGIGSVVGRIAKGFGMQIYAYSRKKSAAKGVKFFTGPSGLSELLKKSDGVVLALPLTSQTARIMNAERLSEMKKDGILVNVARGELVDEKAMYEHLVANPNFRYATDVWWYRENRESLKTDFPFLSLPNFIGTPHVSGPSGLATGQPVKLAVENTIRYLKRLRPRNIVDQQEYKTSYPY
ncbi:MAG TPA: NAD(P)-dependent oxidoreductase [Candidatus Dormibacteraeota bacterium]|nr:NAD(P)-dependent oxidoreductase [Candidatus Dormibacteraeota bacterium]